MTVRESIINELMKGVIEKSEVISRVQGKTNVTVQAVYKELRKLVSEEVIIDKNKKLSLTLGFVEEEHNKWKSVSEVYTNKISPFEFLELHNGQSRVYAFSNLVDLDLFWTQAFVILERVLPASVTTYSVIPHDWFYYARPSSDDVWTDSLTRVQRLLITHAVPLDMDVLKRRREQGYTYTPNENPLKQSELEYFTVIGDWVFEVNIDKKVGERLNAFIADTKNISNVDHEKLDSILKQKGIFKLKIRHTPKKAAAISKKVDKYFL